MDDALRPVDLDHRPVALHGGDLAAGDVPQQTGAVQVPLVSEAAIALTEPVVSTAARSWLARAAYG